MYTAPHSYGMGAGAYAKIGTESSAMSASPHQLITMLFDAVDTAITMARHHMARGEIAAKGLAISKAINIVENGLKASLDPAAGGTDGAKLAATLSTFYGRIAQRLLYANLRNDPALLDEAQQMLGMVSSAWREISPAKAAQAPDAAERASAQRFCAGA